MADWESMALENLKAARSLRSATYWRACVNRSYFSAYAAVTKRLSDKGESFGAGRNGPSHAQIPSMVLNNLDKPDKSRRKKLKTALARLRGARIVADYIPMQTTDRTIALDCLRDAHLVAKELGFLEAEADGKR